MPSNVLIFIPLQSHLGQMFIFQCKKLVQIFINLNLVTSVLTIVLFDSIISAFRNIGTLCPEVAYCIFNLVFNS